MDANDKQRERERQLPPFERDDEREAGGGVLAAGGTATVRGTDDEPADLADDTEGDATPDDPTFPAPAAAAGSGGAPFLAVLADDEDPRRDDEEER